MIVLDTNVVSELMRAEPAAAVLAWLQRSSSSGLYTTAVTVAEIRYGIARMPEGERRDSLHQAANEIFAAFPRQVLPFDLPSAGAYADVVVSRARQGNPISGFDAQIAAICRSRAATLATRNIKDFTDTGIEVIDPWQDTPPDVTPSIPVSRRGRLVSRDAGCVMWPARRMVRMPRRASRSGLGARADSGVVPHVAAGRDGVVALVEPGDGRVCEAGRGCGGVLAYVANLRRDNGLQPSRQGTFKLSKDPAFAEKVADVIALSLDPPGGAVVLSIDEKTPIPALDRLQAARHHQPTVRLDRHRRRDPRQAPSLDLVPAGNINFSARSTSTSRASWPGSARPETDRCGVRDTLF